MPRILVVEDNEMNRDLLIRRLQRKGFEVVSAADGAEGVERASADGPDVVLMDMSLPVMDGWEAARVLKADERTRDIPIIALTAHAMADDRDRAIQAGCDEYDTKPIDFKRLVSKINSFLPIEERVD